MKIPKDQSDKQGLESAPAPRMNNALRAAVLAQVCFILTPLSAGAKDDAIPTRPGTLYLLSFGAGSPMDEPKEDDLYGRDAGYVVKALKRMPSPWQRVEATFLSGKKCTRESLAAELERIAKVAAAGDLVFIHASTHGTTEDKLLRLEAEGPPLTDANALSASLAKLPCPSLVTIDACMTGGALHSPLPARSAWLLGCTEKQSTSGQSDDLEVPHGYVVLAMCEALRGDADADSDGLVTIGELMKWVPSRATDLSRFSINQDAIVVLPKELNDLPLTRTLPGKHQPLWERKTVKSLNPWGLQDPPDLAEDAKPVGKLIAALKKRPDTEKPWEGSEGLSKPPVNGKENELNGTWASRWGKNPEEPLENLGRAEISETDKGFFAVIVNDSGSYLIAAARNKEDPKRLSGRWSNLDHPEESHRWEGRVVNERRIVGQTSGGPWDFQR